MRPALSLLLAGVLTAGLPSRASAASPAADAAWAATEAAIQSGPGEMAGKSAPERMAMINAREERIRLAYLDFYEKFPDDERHWDAALALLRQMPRFIKDWTPSGEPVRDVDAAAAWKARMQGIEEEMTRKFDSLPTRVQERFEARALFDEIGGLFPRLERKEHVDWRALHDKVVAHLEKYPAEPAIAGVVQRYLSMYERDHTAVESSAEWRALTVNPVVRKSELIAKRLEVIERETGKPMEMAFTAVDGRDVDLAKLRGKVVLIDFWATWCGPCIAELPNVKKVYSQFHDEGFEVIGISLEDAHLKPGDSPEEIAKKHDAAKKKLMDFTREMALPWPQYYDGRYWNNAISRGRFNINAVPATFLLDRSGTIAAVNVRGPQLETEVRRLLGEGN